MRIRTLPLPATLALLALAALAAAGCGTTASSAPTGSSQPARPASTAPASTQPASTTPAAPASSPGAGTHADGSTVTVNGDECLIPVADVSRVTGVDLTVQTDVVPSCAYTADQPTYDFQNLNVEVRYVSAAMAAASVAGATPLTGYPAGTKGYESTTPAGEETIVELPGVQAIVWAVGNDGNATLHAQQALALWLATGTNLLGHIPSP